MVPDVAELQAQNDALQQRLLDIRKRRAQVECQKARLWASQQSLEQYENQLQLEQQTALADYQSSRKQTKQTQRLLQLAQQWNILSDCFHISHRGAFGTINGLRLGAEAPPLDVDSPLTDNSSSNNNNVPASSGPPPPPVHHRFFGGGSVDYFSQPPSQQQQQQHLQQAPQRVPWSEINGALGHVVLLLSTLASRCPDIHYRHTLVPVGSTSKIGLRRSPNDSSPSLYNLYFDDGFSFFGRRNFNIALQGLLECVHDAVRACTRRDRTIAVPHPISENSSGGNNEWTIGGLSVAFGTDGVVWTKAMKYLLTDLKHLLTFRALVLWDPPPAVP